MLQRVWKTAVAAAPHVHAMASRTVGCGAWRHASSRREAPAVVPAEKALEHVRSGDTVFVHTAAATPNHLVDVMTDKADDLRDVTVCHLHTEGDAPYMAPGMEKSFRANNFFIGKNARDAVNEGRADFTPIFLSEVPLLFKRKKIELDVALISVSPPDSHGYVSLGPSVDSSLSAVWAAKTVIAQVNKYMPRTHGEGLIHVNNIDYLVEHDEPLPEGSARKGSVVEEMIGRRVAGLIEDGATLQMGIGTIPDAVLKNLTHLKNVGIHTEMMSDGVIDLIESGVVNNSMKKINPHVCTVSFMLGTRRLYDFVDDNPFIQMYPSEYVNNVGNIALNPHVCAINSCIEVDLTGQVVSDSIGKRFYSGVGGQIDFLRGAALSEGGCPILAFPSTTRHGESRIVSTLKPGAGVVTTRAHAHWVVTEFGAVDLFGLNVYQRAKELIRIAHPDHRERLEREAHELRHLL